MSQLRPACIQCGGTDYILESGFYFCSECQVQSQDIREEVFDDYWKGQKTGRVSLAVQMSQEVATQDSSVQQSVSTDNNLTSWEVLNIVLRGLVDELNLLGAPKMLKLIVLQLWVSYLMKIEAAFVSKHIEKKPRLGLNFRRRDAVLIYGTSNDLVKIYKRPIYRKKRERKSSRSSEQTSSTYSNKRIEKYRLSMKKKKLAKAEYEQSSVSSQASEITLESLSERSFSSSHKSYKLRYSKKAKAALTSMLDVASEIDNDARSSLQKKVLSRDSKSVQHASMSKILAILRLALLILDSEIHLGDLLRWSEEGYFSLLNAEKLLPSGASVGKDLVALFVSTLNSRPCINRNVIQMAELLGVIGVSSRILPLIERYLKELCLPGDMLTIIKTFIELSPPKLKLTASVNYEGRAMAYIIFTLKFMFGLDGETEKRISKIAKIINRRQESNQRRFFNWSEWVRYINCRSSIVSVYHQLTRDLHHPMSTVGGSKPFLSHWDKVPARQTLQRKHVISPAVKDSVSKFLQNFSQEPVEPFRPSLSPLSSILMDIFDRDLPIPDRAKKILDQEFSCDSVEYLYDIAVQEEISAHYNINFEEVLNAEIVQVKPVVFEGSSQKPSHRGNKKLVDVIIDSKEGKSDKRNRNDSELAVRRGLLPDPVEFLQGEKLKDKSGTANEDTLSTCGRRYWVYHGSFSNVRTQIGIFNYLAEHIFPTDFLWLLKEASMIAHVCPRDLYTQLSYVEKMYLEFITKKRKPRKFFTDHW